MKNKRKNFTKFTTFVILVLTIFMLFAVPSTVNAQTNENGDKYVVGGRYRLQTGETITGNLFVFGGTAILEQGSAVNGDVILVGGTLEVSGTVSGSVNAIGGTISLLDEAVIHGDLNLTSVTINKSPNAIIDGKTNENTFSFNELNLEQIEKDIQTPVLPSPAKTWVDFMINILWACVRILAISALAALAALIIEKPTNRVRQSIIQQPAISTAFGVLTAIVAPVIVLLLTITLILIPVALIVIFALTVAGLFGWIAIGYEVGLRVEKSLKQNWAPAITAGVGTFFLTLVSSLIGAIPCVGWFFPVIVSIVGLGGVMISRFGTMVYTSGSTPAGSPPPVNPQNQVEAHFNEKPEEHTGEENADTHQES